MTNYTSIALALVFGIGLFWHHRTTERENEALHAQISSLQVTVMARQTNPVLMPPPPNCGVVHVDVASEPPLPTQRAAAAVEPEADPPAETAASKNARKEATETVDTAIRRGALAAVDVRRLRQQLTEVDDPEFRRATVETLQRAIGERRVTPPSDPRYIMP
jgi:hypothetical protein